MSPANTKDATLLLHAYLDGELDVANTLALEKRIESEPSLAIELERIAALKHVLREKVASDVAPAELRARIERTTGAVKASRPSWRTLAASVVVTALVAGGVTWNLRSPAPFDATREAVVDSHIRSLMAPQPVDVASSDQHNVKPWFNGRVPQAPRVVDLAGQEFPLVGGRVDVLGREPVPTLVYRRRKHLISVVASAADGRPTETAPSVADGYNIVRWTDDGVLYWAISDLEARELAKFVELFRGAVVQP